MLSVDKRGETINVQYNNLWNDVDNPESFIYYTTFQYVVILIIYD